MLDLMQPGELSAVLAGVVGLGVLALRIRGRVRLAREQRKAMAAVAGALAADGRSVRVVQQVPGGQWSLELRPGRQSLADGGVDGGQGR